MNAPQPDLRVFLTLVIGGCGLVVLGRGLVLYQVPGWGWMIAGAGAFTVFFALWCLVAVVAPRVARLATTLAICGFVGGSLLACGIFSSREVARRNACQNNLRQLGLGMQEFTNLAPGQEMVPGQTPILPAGGFPEEGPAFPVGSSIPASFLLQEPSHYQPPEPPPLAERSGN
jgi:hypothetical protein